MITEVQVELMAISAGVNGVSPMIGRMTVDTSHNPGYAASPQPIRNGDIANLSLSILGLPQVPGSLIQTLRLSDAVVADVGTQAD